MKSAKFLTAFAAALGTIALAPNAVAEGGKTEQASSQRATVAQASARIVSAKTFSFSAAESSKQDDKISANAGRSEIVRDCADADTEKAPTGCTDIHIIDLH